MIGLWKKSVPFLLLLVIGQSRADEIPWSGCSTSGEDQLISRDGRTLICVSVGPSQDWANGTDYIRYTFEPKADEYSRFTVPNSYRDLITAPNYNFLEDSDVSVFAASHQAITYLRRLYDREKNYIYPHLTAIVDVTDGVVKGILWDDSCVFCSSDKCLENTYKFDGTMASIEEPTKGCYITKEQCDAIHEAGGNECDLTVYFTWYGTDKDGKPLTSANQRFSMFNPRHIKDSFKDRLPNVNLPNWPW